MGNEATGEHIPHRSQAGGEPYDPARRYQPGFAPVLLTGVQAAVRLLVEQNMRDAASARATSTFISGYPGSPLAGLDKLLHELEPVRAAHAIVHRPGLNEELAATAVWGSQQIPGRQRPDSIVGVWYGKGPGVDRAGDALRHGNTYGANPDGGVLVLVGDDPGAKSSTVPCSSERTLASFMMPVLTPRNATELIRFGLYGVALSRLSGCWIGMKILADVADGLWTVQESFADLQIVVPPVEHDGRPWTYRQMAMRDPRESTVAEAQLLGPRWAAVQQFGAANPLDEITVDTADAWLGIAATGTAYDQTVQALHDLGLEAADLPRHGIRLLRIGMPYPLAAGTVRQFARGLQQILVVEEKASFVETQVKEILYGSSRTPHVVGKHDRAGQTLVPADGQLTADRIGPALRKVLSGRITLRPEPPRPRTVLSLTPVQRTPYFCSGCPHNRSTSVPQGSLAGGGIGCHTLVTITDRTDQQVLGLTQMGAEGTQWIGQAPFTDVPHIFQNVGDGTYFHSAQLAVQACNAAGVNITFKLLYNSAVAMTGAQDAEGALPVAALTHKLASEGVARTVIVTDEPGKYTRRSGLAPKVRVRHRDQLDAVQRELREVPGVTVIIYDQQCANEARRLRKRGKQPVRTTRVVIDEEVCEGCGDCGAKSNCLSVQPVETELGRKTRIDQTSCNTDYSCLLGDCPSFLTVEATASPRRRKNAPAVTAPDTDLVEPALPPGAEVFSAGIGGTGIVTVNQLLATAALRHDANRGVVGLDQVGLSQKAGPVTSHLRIGADGAGNRVPERTATVLLAFDALTAADPKNLRACSPETTVAVVSTSQTPTGTQVSDAHAPGTDLPARLAAIRAGVREVFQIDALGASEALLGTTAPANLLLVGAAYQLGALPMTAETIETAIGLNGVAVEANRAAFRWGRLAVADPSAFAAAVAPTVAPSRPVWDLSDSPLDGPTREAAAVRAQLLADHSGTAAARAYVDLVERAWTAERAVGERCEFSLAVARGVAHLLAYKDEYEVARLLTRPQLLEQVRQQVPGADKVTFNLHPPVLRAMGVSSKLRVGSWARPLLRATAAARRLRGTALDPFGRGEVRRVERELAHSHAATAERLIAELTADTYDRAVQIASAAELVRGYEHVKLASVERYRQRLVDLGWS